MTNYKLHEDCKILKKEYKIHYPIKGSESEN